MGDLLVFQFLCANYNFCMASLKDQTVVVTLTPDNHDAFIKFTNAMREAKMFKNNNHAMNAMIEQWRSQTPAVFRGYKKP